MTTKGEAMTREDAAADRMTNQMRAAARKEYADMIPCCADCGTELYGYESCYCEACEAAIEQG